MRKVMSWVWPNITRKRIEAMRPKLYRMAYAWCHDADLADDLTQEALTKALSHSDQLRESEALGAWLYSILNNCWRDHLRSRRQFDDVDELDELIFDPRPGPEGDYERHQTCHRVRTAIASLPLAQRQVLTLVDIEEYSYADVARILNVPVGTVMSRLSRARLALKSQLLAQEPTRLGRHMRRVK